MTAISSLDMNVLCTDMPLIMCDPFLGRYLQKSTYAMLATICLNSTVFAYSAMSQTIEIY